MSHTDRLVLSGNRLKRQSLLFLEQTHQSGAVFVSEVRAAGVAFGDEMNSATQRLARATGRSAISFRRAFQKEVINWRNLAIKTRDAYLHNVKTQVSDVEGRATLAREALRPRTIHTRVLEATHELLSGAQDLVDQRLDQAAGTKTASRATSAAKKKPAIRSGRAPIRNYDRMTARDVVGRIQRLSPPQATALLDYEQAGKNRTTVIRAAKQRLAAS